MLNSCPLITAAVTCYNARYTIKQAVRSAQAQDWPNLDIVVVDDCSTDGSDEVLDAITKQDARVRFVRHALNLGVGAARNTLLGEARGDFVAFFDDDDESHPNRLSQQYQRIEKYEKAMDTELIASFTARRQIFPNGFVHYEPTVGMDITPAPSGEAMADLILLGRPLQNGKGSCATCSLMARRSVFQRVGGFDATLRRGEDTDFNLRLAMLGGHFAGVAAPLVIQSMTISQDKQFDEERKNVFYWLEKHRDYLEKKNWFDFSVGWFNMKYDYLEGCKSLSWRGLLSLIGRHPLKTAQRLYWSLPNLHQYQRALSALDEADKRNQA